MRRGEWVNGQRRHGTSHDTAACFYFSHTGHTGHAGHTRQQGAGDYRLRCDLGGRGPGLPVQAQCKRP
jgi:hypothetical protein